MFSRVVENTSTYNLNKENLLREVTVKISLKRINMQEGITVEVLLNSSAMELVMSLKFTRKQEFKLKKIERPIYVRNIDSSLNKEGPIEHIVEVNIYYQGHRERTEIDVIGEQKWKVILEMLWLAYHILRSQEMDLVFLIFFSYFYFIFDLFFFIPFLELRLRLE